MNFTRRVFVVVALASIAAAQSLPFGGIPATPSGVTPALVSQSNVADDTSVAVTTAIDTTGATLLVVPMWAFNVDLFNTSFCTYTSSPAQTWHQGVQATSTARRVAFLYAWAPTTSSTATFTLNCGLAFPAVQLRAYSGVLSSGDPLDVTSVSTTSGTGTTQPGSITPTASGELLVTMAAIDTNSGVSVSAPFTNVATSTDRLGAADYVQPTAGAINPTWTVTGGSALQSLIAAFKHQ